MAPPPDGDKSIAAELATFSFTGESADIRRNNITLSANAASFLTIGIPFTILERHASLSAEAATFNVDGQSAGLSLDTEKQIAADAASFLTIGIPFTILEYHRSIAANAGSFLTIGIPFTILEYARVMTADAGSFTLTGQDATFEDSPTIMANAGTFTLTGQAANIEKAGQVITAESGTFTLSGQNATPKAARKIAASGGTFTLSGQAATLRRGKVIIAEGEDDLRIVGAPFTNIEHHRYLQSSGGTFSYTGQSATLNRGKIIAANAGTFTLTGIPFTNLEYSRRIVANGGTFSYTGQVASLERTKEIDANAGTFSYTGQAATLTKSVSSCFDANCTSEFTLTIRLIGSAGGSSVGCDGNGTANEEEPTGTCGELEDQTFILSNAGSGAPSVPGLTLLDEPYCYFDLDISPPITCSGGSPLEFTRVELWVQTENGTDWDVIAALTYGDVGVSYFTEGSLHSVPGGCTTMEITTGLPLATTGTNENAGCDMTQARMNVVAG